MNVLAQLGLLEEGIESLLRLTEGWRLVAWVPLRNQGIELLVADHARERLAERFGGQVTLKQVTDIALRGLELEDRERGLVVKKGRSWLVVDLPSGVEVAINLMIHDKTNRPVAVISTVMDHNDVFYHREVLAKYGNKEIYLE